MDHYLWITFEHMTEDTKTYPLSLQYLKELTCPLQVTDDYFITQLTHVAAPLVPWSLPLNSDWLNRWLLSLEKLPQRKAVRMLHVNVFNLEQQYKLALITTTNM